MKQALLIFVGIASLASRTYAQDQTFKSDAANKAVETYKEDVNRLNLLVKVRVKEYRNSLIAKLKGEMDIATKAGDLEEALKLRDAIQDLEKETEGEPAKEQKIPEKAVSFGTSKYYAFTIPMSQEEAEKHCEELGGHLARIDNEKEHIFVAKLVIAHGNNNNKSFDFFRIDGSDIAEEGKFVFSNGEPAKYARWGTNGKGVAGPNNTSIHNSLVISSKNGLFMDGNSNIKWCFVCEWEKN